MPSRSWSSDRREHSLMSVEERERVAYHEGGHAILGCSCPARTPSIG